MSGKPRPPDTGLSEEEAVRAAVTAFQQGIDKEKNFAVLVERFYGPVFRFLARRRYSEEDRLDITQEVFLNDLQGSRRVPRERRSRDVDLPHRPRHLHPLGGAGA